MRVIGPTLLFEMVKGNKRVILCGDHHDYFKKQGCTQKPYINLPQFLERLFLLDPTKQWDFYLEQGANFDYLFQKRDDTYLSNRWLSRYTYFLMNTLQPEGSELPKYFFPFRDKNLTFYSHQLNLTWLYFARRGCFTNRNCSIKNTRFHLADIRQQNFGKSCHFPSIHNFFIRELAGNLEYLDSGEISKDQFIKGYTQRIPFYAKGLKDIKKCMDEFKVLKQIRLSTESRKLGKIFEPLILKLRKGVEELSSILKNRVKKKQFLRILKRSLDVYDPSDPRASEEFKFKLVKAIEELTDFNLTFLVGTINILDHQIEKKNKFTIDPIMDFIEKKRISEEKAVSKFLALEHFLIEIESLLMDMYVMGRVTRQWSGEVQKNVVILAGSHHIIRYMQTFQKLGYRIRWKARFTSMRCAVVPDWVLDPNARQNTRSLSLQTRRKGYKKQKTKSRKPRKPRVRSRKRKKKLKD